MSTHDDDDGGDDAQLKQLRAVWVSMRESEDDPPDRGLAALMSAAREKAAEMAAPEESWWQRVLAVFRRPPVLALASVTVLLGGALVITQRRDSMKAESTISVDSVDSGDSVKRQREVTPPAEPRDVMAHGSGAGSAATATPPAVAVPEVPPPPPPPPPQPSDEHGPAGTKNVVQPTRPSPRPPRPGATTSAKAPEEKLQEDEGGLGGAVASPGVEDVKTTLDKPAAVSPVQPNGTTTRGPATQRPSPVDAPTTESGDAAKAPQTQTKAKFKDDDSVDSGRLAQVTQLVKQCESAAARGDCPAVRALAKRILSTDAGVYKQRVTSNSAIARCLE